MRSLTLDTERPSVSLKEIDPIQDEGALRVAYQNSFDRGSVDELMLDVGEMLQETADPVFLYEFSRFGIWDESQFVGAVELTVVLNQRDDTEAEIGFWLDKDYRGRGYATIATRSLASYASQRHKRVYAQVLSDNQASIGVLERSGFIKSETLGNETILVFELAEGSK